jgi:ABC-2 type transport system ATP-binding protein
VRQLIKGLAEGHTVILSTHILPEVEVTCGRVIIIDRGRIAAMDTTEALARGGGKPQAVVAVVRGPGGPIKQSLEVMEGVRRVAWQQGDEVQEFHIEGESGRDLREEVFRRVARGGWTLLELREEARTLEEIFVEITAGE